MINVFHVINVFLFSYVFNVKKFSPCMFYLNDIGLCTKPI